MDFTSSRFIFILYFIPLCTGIINNYTNQDILDYFGNINYYYNNTILINCSDINTFLI